MKVLFVIDSFGSGGAQRQMINLALGLKARGHHVEFFIYFAQFDFFRPLVNRAGIPVHVVEKAGKGFSFIVLAALTRLIRRARFDAVIAFLNSPGVYAEVAKVASWNIPLIVSERSSHHGEKSVVGPFMRRVLHVVADKVVANSYSHADWLGRRFWLRGKNEVIYNGVDLNDVVDISPYNGLNDLEILIVGRVGPEKNPLGILKAVEILHNRHGQIPTVRWAGKQDITPSGVVYCQKVDEWLNAHPHVAAKWEWLGERADVPQLLADHHVLLHASFYEGLPNAVCEALAAGRLVLASNVCDHPRLVEDGQRGFLFDPHKPEDIADAIEKVANISHDDARRFSTQARDFAETRLSNATMVDRYEQLLNALVIKKQIGQRMEK